MKAIILKSSKYREKDLIYTAITEDRSISFKVKGGLDPKSPYVWMNNILTVADIDFVEGKYKYPILKEARIISSPLNGNDSLEYLACIQIVADFALNGATDEERYLFFEEVENALASLRSVKDKYTCLAVYFARCFFRTQITFDVDCCTHCGSKSDIVAFDMSEGGFVCRKCAGPSTERDLTPNQLKYCRYVFSARDYFNEWGDKFSDEDKLEVLKKMRDFMLDVLGIKLLSLDSIL